MEELTKFLERKGFKILENLKGDASTREFYRLKRKGETFVLMKFNDRGIEEQIRVHRILGSILPLSRIIDVFYSVNSLLMEDAGDLSLENFVKQGKKWLQIYKELLELIEVLQRYTPNLLKEEHPILRRKLDRERFKKELEFTYTHFILPSGISINKKNWDNAVERLLDFISYRFVVAHRDFHSRNIFIKNGKIIILDYQDSMLAPRPYDYVSLLRDNYIMFPERERKKLEEKAFEEFGQEQYEAVSLQRHLKALGTFGYQIYQRGNRYFSDYIPLTLQYLEGEIRKFSFIELLPLIRD